MKKLILFLLLPLWAMAQTSTGQEQEFDYGIKNNSTQTITTPPYLTTTGMDGTQGKIPSALIEKTDNKSDSYTTSSSTTYASTKALMDGLEVKQNSFELDGSLYFYEDAGNTVLASNVSSVTTSFTWSTGNSTAFTLPFVPTNLHGIYINGLKLYKSSQFSIILPNQIEILQTLYHEDTIEFIYEHYNQTP